ncbi:hypothetical protein DFP72DRAFT_909113 [Ephemerocybe angulata]|uniref:Transmembrane protein n=1 Tax=Ephemerocybe angulata TaxID=980116 RepID=A0A8H6M4C9_9AGAR|nr:hypothetical protein DFP72DRAFT_909113 [Tulosesus angulatus]
MKRNHNFNPRTLSLGLLGWLTLGAWAQTREVRVDENDPSISYLPAGSWERSTAANAMDQGGHHMTTFDPTATATFTFTGTGLAFLSPLWGETIAIGIALDGATPIRVDLTDPAALGGAEQGSTQPSAIRWSDLTLANTEHTVVFSMPAGDTLSVLDMLIYYVPDTTVTTTTSSSTTTKSTTRSPTSTSNNDTASSSGTKDKTGLTIAIAVVCAVGGLLLLALLLLFLRRRALRRREHAAWLKNTLPEEGTGLPPPPVQMDEVDDGIRAGGRRFKSIPSRKSLLDASSSDFGGGPVSMYSDFGTLAGYGGETTPGGRTSKLRNVVAAGQGGVPPLPMRRSEDVQTQQTATRSSAASPTGRKFMFGGES